MPKFFGSRLFTTRWIILGAAILAVTGLAVGLTVGNGAPLVRGTLRLEAGVPPPGPPRPDWLGGVRLTFASRRDGTRREVVTDSLGRFALRLRPGQYKVSASGPGVLAQPQNDFTFINGTEVAPQPGGIITVTAGGSNRFPMVIVFS